MKKKNVFCEAENLEQDLYPNIINIQKCVLQQFFINEFILASEWNTI